MTRLTLCLLLISLSGCEPMTPEQVEHMQTKFPIKGVQVEHDDRRSVTCWKWSEGGPVSGLSCLPDWMLSGSEQAENKRQLFPRERDNTPTPAQAPARWNEERYSL